MVYSLVLPNPGSGPALTVWELITDANETNNLRSVASRCIVMTSD